MKKTILIVVISILLAGSVGFSAYTLGKMAYASIQIKAIDGFVDTLIDGIKKSGSLTLKSKDKEATLFELEWLKKQNEKAANEKANEKTAEIKK